MGRQIPIVAQWPDEIAIIRQLAEIAQSKVRVFRRSFGESRKSLWIEDWESSPISHRMYFVWPTRFTWTPRYRQISQPCVPEVEGKWVISNNDIGPVIEVNRQLHGIDNGRLYWSKYFLATKPLSYDVAEFDRLVSSLWRWVRKHGVVDADDPRKPYVLPYACRSGGRSRI